MVLLVEPDFCSLLAKSNRRSRLGVVTSATRNSYGCLHSDLQPERSFPCRVVSMPLEWRSAPRSRIPPLVGLIMVIPNPMGQTLTLTPTVNHYPASTVYSATTVAQYNIVYCALNREHEFATLACVLFLHHTCSSVVGCLTYVPSLPLPWFLPLPFCVWHAPSTQTLAMTLSHLFRSHTRKTSCSNSGRIG